MSTPAFSLEKLDAWDSFVAILVYFIFEVQQKSPAAGRKS